MNRKQKYEKHMKPKGFKRLYKWQRQKPWMQINRRPVQTKLNDHSIADQSIGDIRNALVVTDTTRKGRA